MLGSEFLALDLGSTSIKGARLNVERLSLERVVSLPFPEPVAGLPTGRFEVEPAEILARTRQVVDRLGLHAKQPAGVVLCGQMGGVILTDDRGRALSRYLSWRDTRTLQPGADGRTHFAWLQETLGGAVLAELGHELRPGQAPSLLSWLKRNGQLPAGGLVPLSLGEYVQLQLWQTEPRMELTQAVGLVDPVHGQYHAALFPALGLDDLRWPPLCALGPDGGAGSASAGTVAFPVVGDHQAALLGALLAPGELSINVSTGSQVSLLDERVRLGDYQTRSFFDGRWLRTLAQLPAGRALEALVDLLTELPRSAGLELPDAWSQLFSAAEQAPDTELTVEPTFFAGPMGAQGMIGQITLENFTAGGLFRAALRQMATYYRRAAERVAPDRAWQRLVLSGGLVQKSPLLRQFIRASFPDCPWRVCTATEETLRGLLVLARYLSGRAPSVAAAAEELRRQDAALEQSASAEPVGARPGAASINRATCILWATTRP